MSMIGVAHGFIAAGYAVGAIGYVLLLIHHG